MRSPKTSKRATNSNTSILVSKESPPALDLAVSKAPQPPKCLTPEQLATGLIISVSEARKLLGIDARKLNDDAVAVQIYGLTELAQDLLNYKHFAR